MQFKELFYTIFKALNPESYPQLTEKPLKDAVKYFFFVSILVLVVMFILLIPSMLTFPNFWAEKTANFERLDVNFTFKLREPFYLLQDPSIRVEQSGNNLTTARVLITEDGVYYRSFFFFGQKKAIPLDRTWDLAAQPDISGFFFFMLLSLVFWSSLLFISYSIFLILVGFLVAYVMSWIFGVFIKPSRALKISVYASTILILTQLLLMPFFRTFFLPIIAHWLLIAIAVLLMRDEIKPHAKASKKEIFQKKDPDDGVTSSKHSKKDFEKESEGYVEWK